MTSKDKQEEKQAPEKKPVRPDIFVQDWKNHPDLQDHSPFFNRWDWMAFWITAAISLFAYIYTLAPSVTLEDSGELAVASDYLGVPHPPGYPIWTLLTWFFQWVFHWKTFYGQPNPAWAVGLFSAVSGGLSCAILGLLISKSAQDILATIKGIGKHKDEDNSQQTNPALISVVAGITGGLLFTFSSVLWSQSVIVEVYSLNSLFFCAILLMMYRWMERPWESNTLYITGFLVGLGLTNHQSLTFLGPSLLAAIWFRDRQLFRDCLAALFAVVAIYMFWQAKKLGGLDQKNEEIISQINWKVTIGVICMLAPVGLFLIERKLFSEWKRVAVLVGITVLGLSFYLYMPFASEQNPPMNWGYPRTPEGFWHAFSRGQYEKINPIDNLNEAIDQPSKFFKLTNKIVFETKIIKTLMGDKEPFYYISVLSQFTGPISLLGFLGLFFMRRYDPRLRTWMWTLIINFVSLTFLFIIFQWPKPDVQTLFIGRVQYIQAHAVFAVWIAYGIAIGLMMLKKPFVKAGMIVSLLLPTVLIARNAYDEEFLKYVGGCEMHGHDFGWQFGNYQLRGAAAIIEEYDPDTELICPDCKGDKVTAREDSDGSTESCSRCDGTGQINLPPIPDPAYPPTMATNAIFYGGTDPGRFVPTYMIYSADVRSDVYLITQNALADNTYMNVMRDLYGDQIWIPSQQDSNYAFQKYVKDVQEGRIQAGADLSFQGGRVSVQGVQGVMTINGILARMIFEANKHKHAFYVEESYVIPWMYPYLTPHGLIMKINPNEIATLDAENVKQDREFWDWYVLKLTGNPKFHRDIVARKTFSKLRSAIAGIYAYRRMYPEAEHAFQQALDLYPLSPEANFRLADIYMQQRKFAEAQALIEQFLVEDPGNEKVESFLGQVKQTAERDARRTELEQVMSRGGNFEAALELLELYHHLKLPSQFENLTKAVLSKDLPPPLLVQAGQVFANSGRVDLLEQTLLRYLQKEPNNTRVMIDLAAVQTAMVQRHQQQGQNDQATSKASQALETIRRAVQLGGDPVRDQFRNDRRFDPIRNAPAFKQMVPDVNAGLSFGFPKF